MVSDDSDFSGCFKALILHMSFKIHISAFSIKNIVLHMSCQGEKAYIDSSSKSHSS